jgi:hypothetical protein
MTDDASNDDSNGEGEDSSSSNHENQSSVIVEDDTDGNSSSSVNNNNNTTTHQNNNTTTATRRRSVREQKQRTINMTPVKVRYDMDCVPLVDRPKLSFWDDVKVWPPRALKDPSPPILPSPNAVIQRRLPNASPKAPTPVPTAKPLRPQSPLPNSVIWKPAKRKDWEDSVSELTAVCTSAALRKHTGPPSKFVPPLSREYIRDRIDIDDPLRGCQIRHASGGWLQGFCLWTNFTTWTHDFVWDSLHPKAGLNSSPYIKDADGTLSKELQALHRSGDPSDAGIVFENIAEIALLGGLGCGELLLRMALEEILKVRSKSNDGQEQEQEQQYKYVVMQATNGSRAFYERFGFRRVGAICRYASDTTNNNNGKSGSGSGSGGDPNNTAGTKNDNPTATKDTVATGPMDDEASPSSPSATTTITATTAVEQDPSNPTSPTSTLDNPIQGYRHWTHHNESQHSLDLHGGPSYMMCLKLPEEPLEGLNLLKMLASCFVSEKPTIESVGAATTPTSKRKLKRQSSTGSNYGNTPPLPNLGSGSTTNSRSPMVRPQSAPPSSSALEEWNSNKRRKVSMDKLDLGNTMDPLAHGAYPTLPNGYPYPPPPGMRASSYSSSFPPSSSASKLSKQQQASYSQLLANAVANKAPSKAAAAAAATKTSKSRSRTPTSTSKKARSSSSSLPPPSSWNANEAAAEDNSHQAIPTKGVQKIDRTTLVKQKVKSYPRDREHFFNKVVQPKHMPSGKKKLHEGPYYFVLNYNERLSMVTLCPMAPKGVLSGKRQGRPRYQCVLQNTSANWITAPTRLYDPIPAFMVMKTPVVSQEAWDILGDP